MDSYEHYRCYIFNTKRLVCIALCIFFAVIPNISLAKQECSPSENLQEKDFRHLVEEIGRSIGNSNNRHVDTYIHVKSLMNEISQTVRRTFTIADLETIFLQHDFPEKERGCIAQILAKLKEIECLDQQKEITYVGEPLSCRILMGPIAVSPFIWIIDCLFGNKKSKYLTPLQVTYPGEMPEDDKNIPDDMIIGAVEVLVGCLLLIIPSGATQTVGVALISDGARRVGDSLSEYNQNMQINERREYGGY